MNKYFVLFKQVASQFVAHRLKIISKPAFSFITPIIIITALSQARPISNINSDDLLSYYAVLLIFLPFLNLVTQDYLSELTFSGEINNFLVKPIDLYRWVLVRELSERLVTLFVIVPLGVILTIIFLPNIFTFELAQVLQLIVVIVLSFILSFNFAFFIGIFSFWIDEFWAISNVKSVMVSLLGGIALPYVFFPEAMNKILYFSFFPYLVSWPTRIVNGELKMQELAIALVWILISYVAIHFFLKAAIKKYSFTAG